MMCFFPFKKMNLLHRFVNKHLWQLWWTHKLLPTNNSNILIQIAIFSPIKCKMYCVIDSSGFLFIFFSKASWYLFTSSNCLSTSASLCQLSFPWHQRQPSSHTMICLDSLCQIKEQQPWADCQTGMLQDILDKYYNVPQSRSKYKTGNVLALADFCLEFDPMSTHNLAEFRLLIF